MPLIQRGSIRCLRRSRCMQTLFTGGDVVWSEDGERVFAMCGGLVSSIPLTQPLLTSYIGSEEEGLKVSAIALDAANTKLALAYSNGLLREMSVEGEGGEWWKSAHSAPVMCMIYSSDGALLITGSADHSILVWNVSRRELVGKLRGPSVVSALLFTPSRALVAGYTDGTVQVFHDLEGNSSYSLAHTISAHTSRVTSLCMEGGASECVVAASRDHTATLFHPTTGEKKATVLFFEAVEGAAVGGQKGRLFTVGEEGKLKEWDMKKSKLLRTLPLSQEPLDALHYNERREELMAVTQSLNILFIDVHTLTVKRQIVGMHDEVFCVALAGKDDECLLMATNSPQLSVYDTATFSCSLVAGHSASVVSVGVSGHDRSLCASSAKDNLIIVWRLHAPTRSLAPLAICSGHTGTPSSLSFSHSHVHPFLVSTAYDTMLKLWSLSQLPSSPAASVQDAVHLSCSSTLKAHGKDATCVDVSPSDCTLVTGGMDKMAKLWKVDTSKMQLGILSTLSGHKRGVWDAKFSTNGEKVATACGDMMVRLYAVADSSILATLQGHSCTVLKVMWVNNGSQVLSADSGGIVRVWDAKSGVCDLSQEAHDDKIWSVCCSRGEEMYVTGGSDGKVVLWEDATEKIAQEEMDKAVQHQQHLQSLDNMLRDGRLIEALQYALGLDRPHCALKVVSRLCECARLEEAVALLDKSQLLTLLQWLCKWNTNTRSSHAAQETLHAVLCLVPPEELLRMNGIGGMLAELLPYTKRHSDRIEKSRQDVSLLEFTWRKSRAVI